MNANERESKFTRSSARSLSRSARGVRGFRGVWPSGLLFALSVSLAATVSAGSLPDGPYVSTSAEAVMEADPDFALIAMTWRTVEESAEAAREKADQAQRRLVELLAQYEEVVDERRLTAMQFGAESEYDPQRRQQVQVGFYGQFSVELKVRDFEKLPELHYRLAGLEWHSLANPQFEVDNREGALNVVRRQALDHATARARELAESGGSRLGAIWGIIHDPMHDRAGRFRDASVVHINAGFRAERADQQFALPLEPRPVRFEARVGVVYRLEPASD